MLGFVVRLLASALSLWIAQEIVPGMSIRGTGTFVFAAFLLGLVNALIRPIVVVLTFPFTILTLGLFLFVVNAAMLGLVAWLLPGFVLTGFGPALLGSIVVGAAGWVLSWFVGGNGKLDVMSVRQSR